MRKIEGKKKKKEKKKHELRENRDRAGGGKYEEGWPRYCSGI